MTDKYFTIVFKDLTSEERVALWNAHLDKISASSYSHVMDDRDQLLGVLSYAECALGDIGDADRKPGDDLEWCERRAEEVLPRIRELLLAHGKTTTATTTMTNPITPPPELVERILDKSETCIEIIRRAYAAGANMELEACVNYVDNTISGNKARALRAIRRPKPPSLKELALERCNDYIDPDGIIRRALEALDD